MVLIIIIIIKIIREGCKIKQAVPCGSAAQYCTVPHCLTGFLAVLTLQPDKTAGYRRVED